MAYCCEGKEHIAVPPNTACTGRWGLPLRGVRGLEVFSSLQVFSALKQNPRPPQRQ
jgi:hypothetical protein